MVFRANAFLISALRKKKKHWEAKSLDMDSVQRKSMVQRPTMLRFLMKKMDVKRTL